MTARARCRISERKNAAYHEAGHAVFAELARLPVRSARVGLSGAGRVQYAPAVVLDPLPNVFVSLAGIASEAQLHGLRCDAYYFSRHAVRKQVVADIDNAHRSLMRFELYDHRLQQMLVLDALISAGETCRDAWPAIERIATALLRHRRVPGAQLKALARATELPSPPCEWSDLQALIARAAQRACDGDYRGIRMPALDFVARRG